MESIFDIFGAHDPVKTTTVNPSSLKLSTVKGTPSSQGLLPNKQIIKNGISTLKEKKVLSDVGNKIKGLDKKLERNSNEDCKKLSQGSKSALNSIHKTAFSENDCLDNSNLQENPKIPSCLLWESGCDSNDIDNWPAVETQGPSFWIDDDYECMWPKTERPVIEDFRNAAKIWDIRMKNDEECLRPPSPLSVDMNDNFDFCLDTPEIHLKDLTLEEVSVKFPWEI